MGLTAFNFVNDELNELKKNEREALRSRVGTCGCLAVNTFM